MAFTRDELGRGAFLSWGYFIAMLLAGSLAAASWSAFWPPQPATPVEIAQHAPFLLLMALVFGIIFAGPVSLFTMIAGLPFAWLLGRAMRRVEAVGAHLAVYLLLGMLFGSLAFWVSSNVIGGTLADAAGISGLPWIAAVAASIAVPLGWWRTAHLALLEDKGLRVSRARRDHDPDAAAEDAALES